MKVLFIGDIVGQPGRQAVTALLSSLQREHGIALTIANAENAAGGFGITPSVAEELFRAGIDLLTSGNHIWDKKEAELYIAAERRLLRPANYPEPIPGSGVALWEQGGRRVGVLNLQGRVFMPTIDCPFQVGEEKIALLKQTTDLIIIDFHAEATSEKQAFARFVDGRVSAVLGTHTHVQTADEQILPAGTAFISDVGMTGPSDSVIGMESPEVIQRFLTQMPSKFRVAKGAPLLSAVVLDLDEESGKAKSIRRLQIREEWGSGA
ncbi:MAG: TIGR00282 family metallophosphoesterase [candidate division NC10 bacterium]|nr:TIGR00282 family metallophosphoesterase [candidate division NC10 bacterium]